MIGGRKVLVSTYGRARRKLNVARKHLPHDRLVLVCDPGTDTGDIRENEEERGAEFKVVPVDPYDFETCLEVCYDLLEGPVGRRARVNVSCGPKTLVGAMIFAAFHAGVEVYHCDVIRGTGEEIAVRLPTMTDFELRRRFTDGDWTIIGSLGRPKSRGRFSKVSGLKGTDLDRTLSRLEREGLLVQEVRKGGIWVVPTAIGRFFSKRVPDLKD